MEGQWALTVPQTRGHQQVLPRAVPHPLAVPRKQQPAAVAMPPRRVEAQQVCLRQPGASPCPPLDTRPPADLTALAEPREGHPRPAQAVDTGAPKTEAGLCPQMDPAVGEAVCSG